jgi:hypothetical protein
MAAAVEDAEDLTLKADGVVRRSPTPTRKWLVHTQKIYVYKGEKMWNVASLKNIYFSTSVRFAAARLRERNCLLQDNELELEKVYDHNSYFIQ